MGFNWKINSFSVGKRGHSHRRRVVTVVKMQSKGQGTFLGSVKRSSDVLGPMSSTAGNQKAWSSLCTCAVNRWSRAKTGRGQVVKAIYGRSKSLTVVAALDTAPMGVTPPPWWAAAGYGCTLMLSIQRRCEIINYYSS